MLSEVHPNAPIRDWPLPRGIRNSAFLLAQEKGLNPDDFDWKRVRSFVAPNSHSVMALLHSPTGSYYVFDVRLPFPGARQQTELVESMHPGPRHSVESFDVIGAGDRLPQWLDLVAQEASQPDLWQNGREARAVMKAAVEQANTPFTAEEVKLVGQRLAEVEANLLKIIKDDEEHRAFARGQFAYLREASERTGRKDWLNIALNVLLALAIEIAPTKEVGQSFLRFAWSQLGAIYHITLDLLQQLPQLPPPSGF